MFGHKRIPHPLYELLPYLYVGTGAMVMVLLPNVFGLFSALLLFVAGVWIWRMRRIWRSAARPGARPRASGAASLSVDRDSGLVQLEWSPKYENGHVTLDTQHRKLFELANTLLNAILDEKPKLDVELLLEELIRDLAHHFRTEESVLAQRHSPLLPEHQASHRKLLADCKIQVERYCADELKAGALFKYLAHDVVAGHILKEDFGFLAGAI